MRSDRSQIWFLKIDSLGNMEWNQTYGTSGSRYFVIPSECCVIQTSDDGYAIANTVNNRVEMIKIDSAGNVEWTKTYEDGTFVRRLIETSDGGYVLLGSAGSFYVHTPWLAGLSPLGDIVWNKTYPNLGGSFSSLIQTNDGNYALIGNTLVNPDVLLVKVDSTGEILWSKTYGSQDIDGGSSIVQDFYGNYVMAGGLWNRSSFVAGSGGLQPGLVKADSAGNLLWLKNYLGDTFLSLVLCSDGSYVLCSSMLDKIDSQGNLLWSKNVSFNGTLENQTAETTSLAVQTSDGGYAVAGTLTPTASYRNVSNSYAWIGKLDPEGNQTRFIPELPAAAIILLATSVCAVAVVFRRRWLHSNNRELKRVVMGCSCNCCSCRC
jgi:serine-aspartate repeat-containing protein C/D/E